MGGSVRESTEESTRERDARGAVPNLYLAPSLPVRTDSGGRRPDSVDLLGVGSPVGRHVRDAPPVEEQVGLAGDHVLLLHPHHAGVIKPAPACGGRETGVRVSLTGGGVNYRTQQWSKAVQTTKSSSHHGQVTQIQSGRTSDNIILNKIAEQVDSKYAPVPLIN